MNDNPHESDPLTPREEELNTAIDALFDGEASPRQPLTPELGMAIRLKTMKETPKLRPEFSRMTEKMLLKEFSSSKQESFWWSFWKPAFAGVLVGSFILAVVSPLLMPNAQPQNIAELQQFESLSEAEALLGSLPVDAQTEEGVYIADIRAELHEINLLRESADLSLDEEGLPGSFPHTQLRDNALEVIEKEERLVAMVDISVDIQSFSEKVSEWPTTNEDVDYDTHAKAVNGYIKHSSAWEEATEKWAEDLILNLK